MEDSLSIRSGSSSSWSQVSGPITKADSVRITIQLDNGKRFIVFVPQTCTIGELQEAALQRSSRFGFESTIEGSDLQTIGSSPISMFPEDSLQEMIGETEGNTFKLCSMVTEEIIGLANTSVVFREKHNGETTQSLVYIRWITLDEALLNAQVISIKADHSPLLQTDSMSKLYDTAVSKFLQAQSGIVQGKINLYLKECHLAAESNPATFDMLGLHGSREYPLDIFIDVVPANISITLADLKEDADLSTLWGFDITMRGVSTFTSCLDILCRELSAKPAGLQEFCQILFEVTHYPPLLLAFASLLHGDWKDGKEACSVRIVANVMHQLCAQIMPQSSYNSTLEASRQVFAWLKMTIPSESLLISENIKLVNSTKIVEKEEIQPASALLPYNHDVAVMLLSESLSSASKDVLVALDRQNEDLARFLAHVLAKHPSSVKDSATNLYSAGEFFLDFFGNWSKLVHHKSTSRPQPSAFDALLDSANSAAAGKLKIIGPLQLGNLAANALPILTLGSTGLVSVYDQEDFECSQKRFFTWNVPQKKEIMAHADPGQYLIQKLEGIISQRKMDGTFDVDAWSDWIQSAHFGEPNEAIVVCMDSSGSMSEQMPATWMPQGDTGPRPSRLTEVKELFKNLAVRLSAMKLSTHLGLITFSSRADVRQKLTGIHLDFEAQVEKISAKNQTAIFNGIEKARELLTDLAAQYPSCRLRIIVLTDGQDNQSTVVPEYLTRRLSTQNIVVDSIVIGTEATSELFKISRATGGYAFASKTQEALFQICVLETMIDLSRRPDIVKVPFIPWFHFLPKAPDMSTLSDVPPCRPHPNQNDEFIALEDAERYWKRRTVSHSSQTTRSVSVATSVGSRGSSTVGVGNLKAILVEIQATINNPHADMDVYVSESDLSFWLVVMKGPPSSPYEAGTFLCYLDLSKYPLKPMTARFITPVLHPNVTKHGKICHPIFDREFTPYTRIYEVLQHVWGLFMSLEARDAVDPLSTLKYWTTPVQAREEIREHVSRFATLSRDGHREKILRHNAASVRAKLGGSSMEDSVAIRSPKRMKP